MSLLNVSQINDNLKKLNDWEFKNNAVSTSFNFSSYLRGIDFVNSIASLAEKENHHPEIKIGWCMVNIEFTSHDLGGVTKGCLKMATLVTKLFEEKYRE